MHIRCNRSGKQGSGSGGAGRTGRREAEQRRKQFVPPIHNQNQNGNRKETDEKDSWAGAHQSWVTRFRCSLEIKIIYVLVSCLQKPSFGVRSRYGGAEEVGLWISWPPGSRHATRSKLCSGETLSQEKER
ncbi:hypothetical protein ZWY2020_026073 [Hordeum vulgare]|nr:hypothetical protein ZWY2020_026073 [Hordeum vulgare]